MKTHFPGASLDETGAGYDHAVSAFDVVVEGSNPAAVPPVGDEAELDTNLTDSKELRLADDEKAPTAVHLDRMRLLEAAKAAAAQKRPDLMLEALMTSEFLSGTVNLLARKWGTRLPKQELQDAVVRAVENTYDAISSGKVVGDLGAWLWKAAANQAVDAWRQHYRKRSNIDPDNQAYDEHIERDDRQSDWRRREAIRQARALLPRIGEGQIVEVMTVLIDAVEQGIEDCSASTIAATLGLSPPTVRSLLSRGFKRLEQQARLAGITLPEEIPNGVTDTDPTEDN